MEPKLKDLCKKSGGVRAQSGVERRVLGVGVGDREGRQTVCSLRAGVRATPSNGSQTWGFHNCISQAAVVVSNRYQFLIT